ncbi:MAG: hypothetical protein KDA61_00550, partial [Planctomycetales bacterium]|nr:hypothetical protein [Planctomycetales bacterium]
MEFADLPQIIQGGMGVGVSDWRLARAVSETGQLGVVSGTAVDAVFARRLQLGDPGGHMRRALSEFPLADMAERVLRKYYVKGGKGVNVPFRPAPMLTTTSPMRHLELVVLANFAEVFLAKEGHENAVGVNYLEKVQIPTLPSLFGAMIARVDYVLMGAGIPTNVPGAMGNLCNGEFARLPLHVTGAEESVYATFDPQEFTGGRVPWMELPKFLPIVASSTLASMLKRKASGPVDGFIVEGPTAGGHNAPPRG